MLISRLVLSVAVLLVAGLAAACGDNPGEPAAVPAPVSLLAWEGDFASPARPVLIAPGGERRPVGPQFQSLDVLRADPSGARGAALAVDPLHELLQLYIFELNQDSLPRQVDVPVAGRAQDLAWSPDADFLAVVLETGAVIFDLQALEPVATVEDVGRVAGPLTGEVWAPDSRRIAFGVSGGVVTLSVGGVLDLVPFAPSRLSPAAALFAGWSSDGRLLALDGSTELYYDHSAAGPASTWEPSLPAEPLHDYVAAVRDAADAAYASLPGATISLSRSTAGGRAVIGVAWKSAGIDDGLQRGPFHVAVAVVIPGSGAVVFTFRNSPAFAGLREGRLVDAVLTAQRP